MKVELKSLRVKNVHLDFDLSLEFDGGCAVSFSELDIGGVTVDEDNQFEGLRALNGLIGVRCSSAEVRTSGALVLGFEDATVIRASPRDDVESWEYTAASGATMLCLPGGDVEYLSAPTVRRIEATRPGLPTIGATAVRISAGDDGGVQFSDKTMIRTAVDLTSAYLVLRESVAAIRLLDDRHHLELSSGYVLR